jgi:hypothetical protein
MSIGNLKTDGNKGNNFPWQLRMLKGLQDLYDTNFETAIVVVECPGPVYTSYLEVRTWDQISTGCGEIENKLSEPTYYLPGDDLPVSGTIVGPGCVMRYTDDSTLLYEALICCEANGVILNDIRTELTSQVRAAHAYNDTAGGTISGANYGFSIANVGTANGTVGGATLKPGYTVSFSPTSVDTLDIFNYDATGTEFLITYID